MSMDTKQRAIDLLNQKAVEGVCRNDLLAAAMAIEMGYAEHAISFLNSLDTDYGDPMQQAVSRPKEDTAWWIDVNDGVVH
jgi:hypothetical protein